MNTIFYFISYEMIWNLNYAWDSNTTLPPMLRLEQYDTSIFSG